MSGVRFLLELCLLAALGYWGSRIGSAWPARAVVAIGAPVIAAVVWGRLVAPQSPRRIDDPGRFVVELVLFGLGAAALVAAGAPWFGAGLFVAYLLNRWSLGTAVD